MTRQAWTAIASALLFVVSLAVAVAVRVPYVIDTPGESIDLLAGSGSPVVAVRGVTTYPTRGQLRLATVVVTRPDAGVTLPDLLAAWWSPDHQVLPREAVYPAGTDPQDTSAQEVERMAKAQSDAAASGLRAAGIEVRRVPTVKSVASQGPSVDLLHPGDFVLAVDGAQTTTIEAVESAIAAHAIGDRVNFVILRDGAVQEVTVESAASNTHTGLPVVGVTWDMGFSHIPTVTFILDPTVGGAGAGLMMALAVYDQVTPVDLVRDRVVAGAGEVDGQGNVKVVTGIPERMASAKSAGATIFLLPAANCVDVASRPADLRLVPVNTLDDAVSALANLADPNTQNKVGSCP